MYLMYVYLLSEVPTVLIVWYILQLRDRIKEFKDITMVTWADIYQV